MLLCVGGFTMSPAPSNTRLHTLFKSHQPKLVIANLLQILCPHWTAAPDLPNGQFPMAPKIAIGTIPHLVHLSGAHQTAPVSAMPQLRAKHILCRMVRCEIRCSHWTRLVGAFELPALDRHTPDLCSQYLVHTREHYVCL